MRGARVCALTEAVSAAAASVPGKLLAGVSGGADSTALLLALHTVRPVDVVALHCNFHLRGEESDRDRQFVERLCRRLGVELRCVDFDVAAWRARNPGHSVEMACRELRYGWFEECRRSYGAEKIFIAHNAGDNAETMLLNLMRGTGLAGLSAMQPSGSGYISRPLLGITRRQIVDYLAERGEEFVTDSTNLESDYRRNFIRNEVMPLLRTRWPQADKALETTRAALSGDLALVRQLVADRLTDGGSALPLAEVRRSASPASLIFHFLRPYGVSPDMAEEMAASVLSDSEPGKRWRFGDHIVEKEREKLRVSRDGVSRDFASLAQWIVVDTSLLDIAEVCRRSGERIAFLDPEREYGWRPPRNGERIAVAGMRGRKRISSCLRERRMSARDKEWLRVLEDLQSGEAVWIPGVKRGSLCAARSGERALAVGLAEELAAFGIKKD